MQCLAPIRIPDKLYGLPGHDLSFFKVPCGKCPNCLRNKRRDWYIRLCKERDVSTSCYFLTITYDEAMVPRSEEGLHVVYKKDVQDWIKRLRKRIDNDFPGHKIRYFLISEYGPETFRPHYHAVFFNLPYPHKFRLDPNESLLKKVLEETWKYGFVTVGEPTPARLNYVAAYCIQPKLAFEKVGLQPVFTLMSRNPGIGAIYIDKYKNYHTGKQIENDKVRDFNFREYRLPRYFRNRVYSESDRVRMRAINQELVRSAEQRYSQKLAELGMSDRDYKRQEWTNSWKAIARSLKIKQL